MNTLENLQAKLRARDGIPEYRESCKLLREQIARMTDQEKTSDTAITDQPAQTVHGAE